ncbi:uncharacterized protein LOC118990099 isoform X2 [Sturnira hondurensis]|uniref:uncharacterized protein LOC118990099 isoform X2 n=1 Tax=Sturnira hondurensis TaxID=192404 RepID=UPI00187AB4E1|nr:uncharacterized protein LOC118990099 isoform X2 [Sturnira hondurensis]
MERRRADGKGESPGQRPEGGRSPPPPRQLAQAPPTQSLLANALFSRTGAPAPSRGQWEMVCPGSGPPAFQAGFRIYRKWRKEASGSRDCAGRGAAATMGREFGKLSRVRHVISYSLSPFEQQAFPHYFSKGVPNVLRRIQATILRAAPPFVAFYLIYTWGTQEFERSRRKDPAAYENDS